MDIYHEILERYWGYKSFRPLQEDIIKSVCEGRDTLGLMPTGGGKSLTFQVPAMSMEGLCLVVTPLIALMKDQVDNLKQRGIKALAIYSGMNYREILTTLENAILGDYKFLYISPERLSTDLFQKKLKDMNISLLVVDEAHCISQWGYDFRPSYLNISDIRTYFPKTPVLALTATATTGVVEDIQEKLGFKEKNVFRKSFERENLIYAVNETEDKIASLCNILYKVQGCTIIYVRSRLKTKEIASELSKRGFSADYFHAGLSNEEKSLKQTAWKNDECRIIVSTNAFGMGIDKPNVRLVVHLDLPNSIEEYFQEAGRAGRDENKAYAIVLYNKNDSTKLKKRVTDEFPEKEFIINIYEYLAYFLQIAEGYGLGVVYDFNFQEFCKTYKLPILPAHNALKILDLSGYIEYTEEVENRSRLMFQIYRDELYHYEFDKSTDQIINTLLRLYTGLFTDYAYIDEAVIAIKVNRSRKEVYETLKSLSKRNILDYIPHKKTPFIIYKQARIDKKYLSIPKLVYEERKQRLKDRTKAISEYASLKDVCRSRILLSYFAEKDIHDCQQCDVCKNKKKETLSNNTYSEILMAITELISNKTLTINEITDKLSSLFDKEDIMKTVRLQIDNGYFKLYLNKLIIVK